MVKIFFLFFLVSSIVNAQVGNFQFVNSVTNLNGNAFGNQNGKTNYSLLAEYGYSKKSSF